MCIIFTTLKVSGRRSNSSCVSTARSSVSSKSTGTAGSRRRAKQERQQERNQVSNLGFVFVCGGSGGCCEGLFVELVESGRLVQLMSRLERVGGSSMDSLLFLSLS